VEFVIHGRPWNTHDNFDGDIVHLNHESNLMHMWDAEAAGRLRSWGKKSVVTFHNSNNTFCSPFVKAWDRVVIHEQIANDYCYIPQGIPVWKNTKGIKPQMKIGSAGFPVGHKGLAVMAQVAKDLGVGFLLICPISPWGDAIGTQEAMHQIHPDAEVVLDWLPVEQVIDRLAECAVTVYLHSGNNPGISASVRLGLATGNPVVVTQERQFHDLWDDYQDEIYLIDDATPAYEHVLRVVKFALEDGKKKPKRILEDMNWGRCGQLYKAVYDGLVNS